MFRFICLLVIFGSAMFDGVDAYYKPGGKPVATDCVDRSYSCLADAANNLCDAFGEEYKNHVCPRSCGVCSCTDRRPQEECATYRDQNLCHNSNYNTAYWCRATCGHC